MFIYLIKYNKKKYNNNNSYKGFEKFSLKLQN